MVIYATELQGRRGWYMCKDANGKVLIAATRHPARETAALLRFSMGYPETDPATLIINSYTFDRRDFTINGTVGGFVEVGVVDQRPLG